MRRERLRLYTESSGPLYFGRIDEEDGRVLHIGRHAIADQRQRPAGDQLARAGRAALLHRDARRAPRRRPPPPAGDRRADRPRLRRRDVRDGEGDDALDRRDRRGHHAPARRRDAPDHLDDHAGAVRADRGDRRGPLVIQGGPGTGKTAVGLHRAAWLLYADPSLQRTGVLVVGPNDVFIAYISAGAPVAGRDERGAARGADPRAGARPARRRADRRRDAQGQRPDGGAARAPAVGARRRAGGARRGGRGPRHGRRRARGRAADRRRRPRPVPQPPGRPRALPRAARELDRDARDGAPPLGARRGPRGARDARAQDEGLPGPGRPRRGRASPRRSSSAPLFKNRKRLAAAAEGLLEPWEVDLLLRSGPPADKTLRPSDVPLLDEARWLDRPRPAHATATSSSTRRRTSRRWSCGWSCAARAASR